MSSFGVVQIAAAVLLGNLLTLMFVKGWQIIEKDDPASAWRYLVPLVPLALVAVVILAG